MVGVALSSDYNGPRGVFVGVMAVEEAIWNEQQRLNKQYYGEKLKFITSLQRADVSMRLSMNKPKWWLEWFDLQGNANGKELSDWQQRESVQRLYDEKEGLADQVSTNMVGLA